MIIIIMSVTIGFQCLSTLRYVEQGIEWDAQMVGGGGPHHPGKSQVIWVDLDLIKKRCQSFIVIDRPRPPSPDKIS